MGNAAPEDIREGKAGGCKGAVVLFEGQIKTFPNQLWLCELTQALLGSGPAGVELWAAAAAITRHPGRNKPQQCPQHFPVAPTHHNVT